MNTTKGISQIVRGTGPVVYYNYPGASTIVAATFGAAGAIDGIAVATDGAANTLTAAPGVVIMGAAALAVPFWFCSASVIAATATAALVVLISSATAVPALVTALFPFRCNPTAATPNLGPFRPPYPIAVPAGLGISAQSGSTAGAQTVSVAVVVATGL